MEKILFTADVNSDDSLSKTALEVLSGAVHLAKDLDASSLQVGLVGGEIQKAADSIAACGAEQFLGVSGEDVAVGLREGAPPGRVEEVASVARRDLSEQKPNARAERE